MRWKWGGSGCVVDLLVGEWKAGGEQLRPCEE